MRKYWLFLLIFVFSGCRPNDQIQTYRVPKSVAPAMPALLQPTGEASASKEITWKTPKGWKEQPASAMRVGSFLITGENGQTADASIIPLSGEAGGDLSNINRWRGQINLGPMTLADLSAQSETIKPGGRTMRYVNFVSHDLLIQNRLKKRLMAAIYHRGDRTWFFKILGEDSTTLSAKPKFMQLLESLEFHEK